MAAVKNEPRPLRSLMFVPGNKEDWMMKAPRFKADALIFDLEDACPEAERPQARKSVRKAIETLGAKGHTIFVRVQGLETRKTGLDLEAVVCKHLHGIFLPKVAGPEDIVGISALLDDYEQRAGLPHGHILVNPLLESARAVIDAYQVAKASPRVTYMGHGTANGGDGARTLGYEWTPEGMETYALRSMVLAQVRAAGVKYPVSGLWPVIKDNVGLEKYAVQTRQMGYEGLMAIYPGHIETINTVFSPTPQQIKYWQRVISSLEKAEASGTTAIQEGGELLDTAHVKTAKDKLAHAKKLGLVK